MALKVAHRGRVYVVNADVVCSAHKHIYDACMQISRCTVGLDSLPVLNIVDHCHTVDSAICPADVSLECIIDCMHCCSF